VDKSYLAVVSGHLKQSFIIDEAIGRDPYNRKKISSRGRKKRSARTHFTPIAHSKDGSYTLLSAKPITGRTHQIRVHLKEHGHPIVGDMTYKGEKHSRLMLHAHKLSISIAPQTEATTLEAAPTGDFLSGLEQLGFDLAAVRIL
jgi:23S rRNA pseudouridine1911/1915/1917 synthase